MRSPIVKTTAPVRIRTHSPYAERPGGEAYLIAGSACPGELLSLSFALEATRDLAEVSIAAEQLTGVHGAIPSASIDVRVVRVWTQAGVGVHRGPPMDVPELLLKDDRVGLHDRYCRRPSGHLRPYRKRSAYRAPRVRLRGKAQASLSAHQTKQVWVAIDIPRGLPAGTYHGSLMVRAGGSARQSASVPLAVEVLPFLLDEPKQETMLWYLGTLDRRRPQHHVTPAMMELQLRDIRRHGFRTISLSEDSPRRLQRAVDTAQAAGFDSSVVLLAGTPECWASVDFGALSPVVYASDELDRPGAGRANAHVETVKAARRAGFPSLASLLYAGSARRFGPMGDIGHPPDAISVYLPYNLKPLALHARLRGFGVVGPRYYWPAHMEKPLTHRVLAGVFLWKSGAPGIAPYCYQHRPQPPFSPFDDFDEWEPDFLDGGVPLRDHMATYPARRGTIPTVQWKGLSEGLTDLRYLTTLDCLLAAADRASQPALRANAARVRARLESALDRFSLTQIEVASPTVREPYPDLDADELDQLRRQIAQAATALHQALNEAASMRRG